jgi:Uma2 family endonuclease
MSIAQSERTAAPRPSRVDRHAKRFNRSSFDGDFMVVIPGQTAEDFELYASETQRCEYVDGVIYMPAPVSDRHQDLVGFFLSVLRGLNRERPFGKVSFGVGVLRLSEQRKLESDVFVRTADADEWDPRALFVVEVLSSNRDYDREFKREIYQDAGIPEIWYVDDRDKALIVVRKIGDSYQTDRFVEGIVTAKSIPGFWIDVAWLWADPLLSAWQCLDTILAGIPG